MAAPASYETPAPQAHPQYEERPALEVPPPMPHPQYEEEPDILIEETITPQIKEDRDLPYIEAPARYAVPKKRNQSE